MHLPLKTPSPVSSKSISNFDLNKIRDLCKAVSVTWHIADQNQTNANEILPSGFLDNDYVHFYASKKLAFQDEDMHNLEQVIINTFHYNRQGLTKEQMHASMYFFFNLETRLRNLLDVPRLKNLNFISLGVNCFPRNFAARWGLKLPRMLGELSLPFDIAIHKRTGILAILESNFGTYLNDSDLSVLTSTDYPRNDRLGIVWNHESGNQWIENNFELLKKRYRSRIKNFQKLLEERHTFFFMVCVEPLTNATDDHVRRIFNALQRLTEQPLTLFFASTRYRPNQVEVPIQELFYEKQEDSALYAYDIPIPSPDYVFWKPEYYTSSQGLRYEMSMIEIIFKIMDERRVNDLQQNYGK